MVVVIIRPVSDIQLRHDNLLYLYNISHDPIEQAMLQAKIEELRYVLL